MPPRGRVGFQRRGQRGPTLLRLLNDRQPQQHLRARRALERRRPAAQQPRRLRRRGAHQRLQLGRGLGQAWPEGGQRVDRFPFLRCRSRRNQRPGPAEAKLRIGHAPKPLNHLRVRALLLQAIEESFEQPGDPIGRRAVGVPPKKGHGRRRVPDALELQGQRLLHLGATAGVRLDVVEGLQDLQGWPAEVPGLHQLERLPPRARRSLRSGELHERSHGSPDRRRSATPRPPRPTLQGDPGPPTPGALPMRPNDPAGAAHPSDLRGPDHQGLELHRGPPP